MLTLSNIFRWTINDIAFAVPDNINAFNQRFFFEFLKLKVAKFLKNWQFQNNIINGHFVGFEALAQQLRHI